MREGSEGEMGKTQYWEGGHIEVNRDYTISRVHAGGVEGHSVCINTFIRCPKPSHTHTHILPFTNLQFIFLLSSYQ